ncbi:MAG: hypothetical protein K2X36_08135, partial [Microbacteriaceae bacterium]|nr:hypothetical protein [Microbacteriaceae bacterium]
GGKRGVEASNLERLVARLKALAPERREDVVAAMHKAIGKTGVEHSSLSELRMEALARRGFFCALKIGTDAKHDGGTPRLCWKELASELEAFRVRLDLGSVIATPQDKDVDHFCTMRVRRRPSLSKGHYVLWALYILQLEEQGAYSDDFYAGLVSPKEMLARPTWLFLARRLNEEAEEHGEPVPFDDVKRPREPVRLSSISQKLYVHDHHVDRMMDVFARCVSPIDGNAHMAVYRMRHSDPDEIMKSFMIWKPRSEDASSKDLNTLHFYKGPDSEGGTVRTSPGRVVPLETGIFIIGGQRSEPLRTAPVIGLRPPPAPFRTMELLFIPWTMLEGNHLFPGLILTQNDKGVPLVGYVCARPVLIAHHEEVALGSTPIRRLAASLERDRAREMELVKEMTDADSRARQIVAIYNEYGTIDRLAERIVDRCNNRPQRSKVPPKFVSERKTLTTHAIESLLEETFEGITHSADPDREFKLLSDLIFAPLSRWS